MPRITPAVPALLLAACAAPGAPTPSLATAPASDAERVVQAQVEAYNRHDIDAFAGAYAPAAVIYQHPDRALYQGTEVIRASYGELFTAARALNVQVTNRIVQGGFVIDHERVTGMPAAAGPVTAVAIYEVKAGRIQNVWFLR